MKRVKIKRAKMRQSNLLNLLNIVLNFIRGSRLSAARDAATNPPLTQEPHHGAIMAKFSESEILMGRIQPADLTPLQTDNLHKLVERLNALFSTFNGPIKVSSGYRRPVDNLKAKGAARSHHLECAAVDLQDRDGKVWAFCTANLQLCEDLGLWLEDKQATPTWVHLQIYPPKSGRRIFKP